MKALFRLKSAINQGAVAGITALISLVPLLYPHAMVLASEPQTLGPSALVFDIKTQNQNFLSYNQLISQDPLVIKLKEYLEDKNSPLAESAAEIVTYSNWKLALSISVVESNMCRFTPKYSSKGKVMESYNCSGIGGENFKRYTSYVDWFADMNALLSKPSYVNRPIEKFIGFYVQPGSLAWLNGVKKTQRDLTALEDQANTERLAMSDNFQLALANTSANPEVK